MLKIIKFTSNTPYSTVVNINGSLVRLNVRFNETYNSYYFDVEKMVQGKYVNIVNSVMLTTGTDLFKRYPEYDLGEMWIVPYVEEYYNQNPQAENIKNYVMWMVMDNG